MRERLTIRGKGRDGEVLRFKRFCCGSEGHECKRARGVVLQSKVSYLCNDDQSDAKESEVSEKKSKTSETAKEEEEEGGRSV